MDRYPNAGAGIFSTLLVERGVPRDVAAHVVRLRASTHELYGQDVATDLEAMLRKTAVGWDVARLRVSAYPGVDGQARVEIDVGKYTKPVVQEALSVRPTVMPGGIGDHKWRDRQLLNDLERQLGAVPLIVDVDGDVLEAAHANVFVVEGTTLLTPPLDGRLLPGIVRRRVLAAAPSIGMVVQERPLSLERLGAADELLLTSSLRGVHSARIAHGSQGRFSVGERLRHVLATAVH